MNDDVSMYAGAGEAEGQQITFAVKGKEVLCIKEGGQFYVNGRLAATDVQVFETFKAIVTNHITKELEDYQSKVDKIMAENAAVILAANDMYDAWEALEAIDVEDVSTYEKAFTKFEDSRRNYTKLAKKVFVR